MPQSIFSAQNDPVAYLEEIKATFGDEDSTMLVVVHAAGEADVLSHLSQDVDANDQLHY